MQKKKQKRFLILTLGTSCFALIIFLILICLGDSISFFYSPTQIIEMPIAQKEIKVGGTIKQIEKFDKCTKFIIADQKNELSVIYNGFAPALMQENIDIVALGTMHHDTFYAKQILIKHDEKYRPTKTV